MEIFPVNDTSPPAGGARLAWLFVGDTLRVSAFATALVLAPPINGLVLLLVLRQPWERIASDFIPLNQLVVELIYAVSSVWFLLYVFLPDDFFLRMFLFSSAVFLTSRPLAQSLVCLEQYLAVTRPLTFLRCKALRLRLACGAACWTAVVALSSVHAVFTIRLEPFWVIAALHLHFLLLMTFCCVSLLRALKRPRPGGGLRDQRGNRTKTRAFIIIAINLMQSVFTQVPLAVVITLKGSIPSPLFSVLSSLSVWTFVVTGFVPALLYLCRGNMVPKTCRFKHN